MTKVYCDGSRDKICFVVEGCYPIVEVGVGETHNENEYRAIIAGLDYCIRMGRTEVELFSDSQLAINQINGDYSIKAEELMSLARRCWNLAQQITVAGRGKVRFKWIPREQNLAGKVLG